jgi:D-aminoacyl-tRNA deacylase
MKALVQRVSRACVCVDNTVVGEIGFGLLVFLGITHDDNRDVVEQGASKVVHLRVFPDAEGRMNLDVIERHGEILVVSQFTLYADTAKGRRPSFVAAASPEFAQPLYEHFVTCLKARGLCVATGMFGSKMTVESVNDGPVTLIVETL